MIECVYENVRVSSKTPDCMKLYITHVIPRFLKSSVNLHFTQLTGVLPSQAPLLICHACTRFYIKLRVTPSERKKKTNPTKIPFFCAAHIMLYSLSAGHIVLDITEAGKQTSHNAPLTQYDPFHSAVTHKCEQKKARVTDNKYECVLYQELSPKPYSDSKLESLNPFLVQKLSRFHPIIC